MVNTPLPNVVEGQRTLASGWRAEIGGRERESEERLGSIYDGHAWQPNENMEEYHQMLTRVAPLCSRKMKSQR